MQEETSIIFLPRLVSVNDFMLTVELLRERPVFNRMKAYEVKMTNSVGAVMKNVYAWMLSTLNCRHRITTEIKLITQIRAINDMRRLFVTVSLYFNGMAAAITLSIVMMINA